MKIYILNTYRQRICSDYIAHNYSVSFSACCMLRFLEVPETNVTCVAWFLLLFETQRMFHLHKWFSIVPVLLWCSALGCTINYLLYKNCTFKALEGFPSQQLLHTIVPKEVFKEFSLQMRGKRQLTVSGIGEGEQVDRGSEWWKRLISIFYFDEIMPGVTYF